MDPTAAAYQGLPQVDKEFYDNIRTSSSRTLKQDFTIPIRTGQAWKIPAGSICRISITDGPQVGDLNLWNLNDPRERMWAARTRQLQAAHVSVYDRLWSNLPFLRPLCTIIDDTLKDYGIDSEGGQVHDLLGTRCDPYVNQLLTNEAFDFHCHSNLTRAILPYHLTEFDVHDVLNVFQCTGLNKNDEYYMKACPAKEGDYFEFFAEIDLLAALSTCPAGSLELPLWGPDKATDEELKSVCHPLKVQVWELADSSLLKGWESPERAKYSGFHGLKNPS